jgi:hypothetical protein
VTVERISTSINGIFLNESQDRGGNLVDFVQWESRAAAKRFNVVQTSTVLLCMIQDGPVVEAKWSADEREWDRRVMLRSQDPTGGITSLAKGQTSSETAIPQSLLEEIGGLVKYFWV